VQCGTCTLLTCVWFGKGGGGAVYLSQGSQALFTRTFFVDNSGFYVSYFLNARFLIPHNIPHTTFTGRGCLQLWGICDSQQHI
jgi:hypothetical protein